MNNYIYEIITEKNLTYHQKIFKLAMEAESFLNVLEISDEAKLLLSEEIICDMFEGNAPYRPRYTMPDYKKFMNNGSKFLELPPPQDLLEAVNSLLILYKHIPTITSFPVYIGQLDDLLEEFVLKEEEGFAYKVLKMFLTHVDKTLTTSFVHANIGPAKTKTGELLLRAEKELNNAAPNLSLKYNSTTPDDFALLAIDTGLSVSKPYFVNHDIFMSEFKEGYGISSCYNTLPLGGGSYTLVRLNLKRLAEKYSKTSDFFNELPEITRIMCGYMDERIKFLVEKSNFFQTNFLLREGLMDIKKFTAMFGVFGMAECVNILLKPKNLNEEYGYNPESLELAEKIIQTIHKIIDSYNSKYCYATDNKFLLHAQSGITCDNGVTPGVRIPVNKEMELLDTLLFTSKLHKYFPAGVSDIFVFEKTVRKNPASLLDIIKGAMKKGVRVFSFYCDENDLIRITGFLVKKSEIEKFKKGLPALHDTINLVGVDFFKNSSILNRKVRNYADRADK